MWSEGRAVRRQVGGSCAARGARRGGPEAGKPAAVVHAASERCARRAGIPVLPGRACSRAARSAARLQQPAEVPTVAAPPLAHAVHQ